MTQDSLLDLLEPAPPAVVHAIRYEQVTCDACVRAAEPHGGLHAWCRKQQGR